MNSFVSKGLYCALIVGGLSLLGVGAATAAQTIPSSIGTGNGNEVETSGDDSVLGGNQVLNNVAIPVTISGNAVSVVGDSTAISGRWTNGHRPLMGSGWRASR